MPQKRQQPKNVENLSDMEKFFAKKWGSPEGLMMLVVTFGIFLISIGIFIWLLHAAGLF